MSSNSPSTLPKANGLKRRVRLLIGVALLVAVAGGSYAIRRGMNLDRLPDIGAPFDLDKEGTVEISDEDNAFTYYKLAAANLQGDPYHRSRVSTWEETPQVDREWFASNRDAIDAWLVGTRKDRAVYHQPRSLRYETDLKIVQSLRTMLWLAELGALRDISLGKYGEAWAWYRGVLRSSRHCGMHGTFVERLVGSSIYSQVARPVRLWSENPKVGATELREALDDLIVINAMTPPLGHNFRAEYFTYAAILDDPEVSGIKVKALLNASASKSGENTRPGVVERIQDSVRGVVLREPERSRRVFRLIWANWLSACDLPHPERARRRRSYPQATLYDPPADAPGSARMLDADELYRWFRTTRLLWLLLPAIENLEKVEERDQALRASLVVDLAVQLYRREHGGGEPPNLEALVGPYLKVIPAGYVSAEFLKEPSNGVPP